jgi:hypothetical protein
LLRILNNLLKKKKKSILHTDITSNENYLLFCGVGKSSIGAGGKFCNLLGVPDGGKIKGWLLTESFLFLVLLANVFNFLGVLDGGKVEAGLLTENLRLILFVRDRGTY